jgi:hypothetical protein
MLKNISMIKGVHILKKAAQNNICGGKKRCSSNAQCGPGNCCNTAGLCQRFGSHGATGSLCDGGLI